MKKPVSVPYLRLVYSVDEVCRKAEPLRECPICGGSELAEYLQEHSVCSRCENKNAA